MTKSIIKFAVALAFIAVIAYTALCGLDFLNIPSIFDDNGIRKGLDLVGGALLIYEPIVEEGETVEDDDIDTMIDIMYNRLSSVGYTEANITALEDKKIQVEIPSVKDPEQAVELLGDMGKLQFVDHEGTVVLEGDDISDAYVDLGDLGNGVAEYFVVLELTSNAVSKFAEATERLSKLTDTKENYIAIVLDESIVSMPFVEERLAQETVVISGRFDAESARSLAGIISSGQMPFTLENKRVDSIGPTLGEKALETSIIAGAIGIALVIVFMIVIYRLPGLISSISLIAYIGIVGIILAVAKVNLTLPGIAGIVLGIGMAVDANVIIFERIKEELYVGKTVMASVKAGFNRAFASIIDSNVTTLIASAVLWYFGTGTVQGFAITLFISIIVSMFTAIFLTRFLLRATVGMNIRNLWLYGFSKKRCAVKAEEEVR